MIKLLALDMDGTLLDQDKKISPENKEAIHQAVQKGVKLVLCTGRPIMGVQPYFDELDLPSTDDEYVIINNGCTTLKTSDWSLVDWRQLTNDDIRFLYDTVRDSTVQLTIFDEDRYIVVGEPASDLVIYDAGLVFSKPVELTLEETLAGEHNFQAMFLDQPENLDAFENEQDAELSQRFSTVRSQPYIYEAMPLGTTKASALKSLAEKLGFTAENVMAIGDAANDLEMLQYAGLGVAMGNASDDIKAQANAVTQDNQHSGVATAIHRYILKENDE